MAINLAEKYANKLDERFTQQSYTSAWTSNDYDFDGTKSVKIYSLDKVGIHNYKRDAEGGTDRFGKAMELGDTVQILTMTQDRSGTFLIDAGNRSDQLNIKDVNRKLKAIWDEEVVPEVDKYRFQAWANGAGGGVVKAAALEKNTVLEAIVSANTAMNNRHVPKRNRACFIKESVYALVQMSDQIVGIDKLGEKAIANGVVGRVSGFQLVPVADDDLPAGVNFICKWKGASVDPMKIKALRAHKNPPGVDGDKGEFRFYHDAFVLANKADGIYVHAQSGMLEAPTATYASGKVTLTAPTGAEVKYTTDGSNPKSSETAQGYSDTFQAEAGTVVRAYAAQSGSLNSPILTWTVG